MTINFHSKPATTLISNTESENKERIITFQYAKQLVKKFEPLLESLKNK